MNRFKPEDNTLIKIMQIRLNVICLNTNKLLTKLLGSVYTKRSKGNKKLFDIKIISEDLALDNKKIMNYIYQKLSEY